MKCPECKVEMIPVTDRTRWFICPKCSYEAKRKPTKSECERLAYDILALHRPDKNIVYWEKNNANPVNKI